MSATVDTVGRLSDKQANEAAKFAVGEWIRSSGLEALLTWQKVEKARSEEGLAERWLFEPSTDEGKAANVSRKILRTFLEVGQFGNANVSAWAREGITLAIGAKGQLFEPLSAGIVGTLAIGLVLASRVKKIGSVEFFQGLPPNLEKVIKSVASSVTL